LLAAPQVENLTSGAIETLGSFDDIAAARTILSPWSRYSPVVREGALQILLSRPDWAALLLDAIAAGDIPANQVAATQRSTLLSSSNPQIAEKAQAVWNEANSLRAEVIAQYRPAVNGSSNASRGTTIYERECAACHKLGDRGHAVGPNLALARHRTADELLIHILDPNREVQPAYLQYVVTDTSGGIFSGLIAADNSASITLRQDRGAERTILKSDIDELATTDKSLMAEGFEKTITTAEMADLIAFLMQVRYQIGTEPGHTEPEHTEMQNTAPENALPETTVPGRE
jgi:putative heme-binding domain-containing protein